MFGPFDAQGFGPARFAAELWGRRGAPGHRPVGLGSEYRFDEDKAPHAAVISQAQARRLAFSLGLRACERAAALPAPAPVEIYDASTASPLDRIPPHVRPVPAPSPCSGMGRW